MAKNAKVLKTLKIFLPFKQGVRSSSLRWVTKKKDTCFASVLLFGFACDARFIPKGDRTCSAEVRRETGVMEVERACIEYIVHYRNSSDFHRASDGYRWHYCKCCRCFDRISYCVLLHRCLYKKNSEKCKIKWLLHSMCICGIYYVFLSTIYFIFVMGSGSVNSGLENRENRSLWW